MRIFESSSPRLPRAARPASGLWLGLPIACLLLSACGTSKGKPAPAPAAAPKKDAAAPKAPKAPKRDEAKYALGEAVYKEKSKPSCKSCHVLEAAGSRGAIGPNLDTLSKTKAEIISAVSGGLGVMPAQKDILTPAEIEAVAYYVVTARKVR